MPAADANIDRYAPPRLRSRTMRSGSSGLATRFCMHDERREQHAGGDEEADRHRVGPAVGLGVREAVDEGEQAGRDEQVPGTSSLGRSAARAVREQEQPADEGDAGEDQVDEHRPAPVGVLGEEAAEQQTDRGAGTGDGAEDAERLAALLRRR